MLLLLYNNPMNTQPFFSVIIPSYNRKPFLETAINSVLKQTFDDLELIIVDDGSSDGTKELISTYDDKRITYLYLANHGVSHARNRGLDRAHGQYIAFLDSDDYWVPEKLSKTYDAIKQFPDINIFHTEEVWYRDKKLLNQKQKHKKPSGFVYKNALPICCISISTVAIRRVVFDAIGTFDETLEACEDYDFWLRATNKYEIKLIPEDLTIKDGGRADQLSSSVWGLDRFRIKSLEKMLSSGTLSTDDHNATLKELTKKCKIFALGAAKHDNSEVAEYYKTLPNKYSVKLSSGPSVASGGISKKHN